MRSYALLLLGLFACGEYPLAASPPPPDPVKQDASVDAGTCRAVTAEEDRQRAIECADEWRECESIICEFTIIDGKFTCVVPDCALRHFSCCVGFDCRGNGVPDSETYPIPEDRCPEVPDAGTPDTGVVPDAGDAGDASEAGVDAGVDAGETRKITFSSKRHGHYDLFAIDHDGQNLTRLTDHPANELFSAWSPDGTKVAFMSNRVGGYYSLYMYDVATASVTAIPTHGLVNASSPSFSPDGSMLAFEGCVTMQDGWDVFTVPINGGVPTRLTFDPAKDGGAAWSPDGLIYFVSERTRMWEVHVMHSDGTGKRVLTLGAGVLGKPAVGDGGQTVAFTRLIMGTFTSEIVAFDVDDPTTFITITADNDAEPSFDPRGEFMLYTTQRWQGNPEVMLLDRVTGIESRLTNHNHIDGAAVMAP